MVDSRRARLIKRAKLAATLLELPVQTAVSLALHDWLREHEGADQGPLLIRYGKIVAAIKEQGLAGLPLSALRRMAAGSKETKR